MNPLRWKREHRLAMLCALALGGFFGVIFGVRHIDPVGWNEWPFLCGSGFYAQSCSFYVSPGYWSLVALWAAIGATISGLIVYIQQLMRS